MNWLKDYSGLTIWLTNRPTLAGLTIRLTTWLKLDWLFSLDKSTDNSTDGLTIRLTNRPTLADLTFDWQLGWNSTGCSVLTIRRTNRLTTRLTIQSLQFRFTIQLTIPLTIQNSAYNTALQFSLQFRLTILSDKFVLTIRPYNLADQNWWNDLSVRAATLPWSKAGVSCRVLRWKRVSRVEAFTGGR